MVVRCETHNWDMQHMPVTFEGMLCPIGRIEKATEEALAKIKAASNGERKPDAENSADSLNQTSISPTSKGEE